MITFRLIHIETWMSPLLIDLADALILCIAASFLIFYWVINPMELLKKSERAEKALVESERRYRSLFENMLEGFAYCRMLFENDVPMDFVYLDVNIAFEKLTGLKNVIGKKVTEVLPGIRESVPELFEIYGRVALTGKTERFETFSESFGGWLLISVYGTEKGYFVAVFDNITEHKQAEKALRMSEARYRELFEANPHPMWVYDLETLAFLAVNDATIVHYGYTREEFLSRTLNDIRPAEDIPLLLEKVAHVRDGIDQTGVWRHLKRDGSIIDVEISTHPLLFDGRRAELVMALDVTAQRRAEAALTESELRYRTLADSGQALIWTSGPDKLCDYFNKPWLLFTGRTMEQELGNGWAEGVHPEDFNRCLQTYVTAFDKREPFSMEYRLRNASGEYRWMLDDGNPRFDGKGNFLGYIGHCLDITERRKAEDLLRKYGEELVALNEASNSVIGIKGMENLFKVICDNALKLFKVKMVWLGLLRKESFAVIPVAHAGADDDYQKPR